MALATRYHTDWRADACLVADFLAPVSTTAAVIVVEPDNAITWTDGGGRDRLGRTSESMAVRSQGCRCGSCCTVLARCLTTGTQRCAECLIIWSG